MSHSGHIHRRAGYPPPVPAPPPPTGRAGHGFSVMERLT